VPSTFRVRGSAEHGTADPGILLHGPLDGVGCSLLRIKTWKVLNLKYASQRRQWNNPHLGQGQREGVNGSGGGICPPTRGLQFRICGAASQKLG
jgi:hypothetical protein